MRRAVVAFGITDQTRRAARIHRSVKRKSATDVRRCGLSGRLTLTIDAAHDLVLAVAAGELDSDGEMVIGN
jgi:hypothetical protein